MVNKMSLNTFWVKVKTNKGYVLDLCFSESVLDIYPKKEIAPLFQKQFDLLNINTEGGSLFGIDGALGLYSYLHNLKGPAYFNRSIKHGGMWNKGSSCYYEYFIFGQSFRNISKEEWNWHRHSAEWKSLLLENSRDNL